MDRRRHRQSGSNQDSGYGSRNHPQRSRNTSRSSPRDVSDYGHSASPVRKWNDSKYSHGNRNRDWSPSPDRNRNSRLSPPKNWESHPVRGPKSSLESRYERGVTSGATYHDNLKSSLVDLDDYGNMDSDGEEEDPFPVRHRLVLDEDIDGVAIDCSPNLHSNISSRANPSRSTDFSLVTRKPQKPPKETQSASSSVKMKFPDDPELAMQSFIEALKNPDILKNPPKTTTKTQVDREKRSRSPDGVQKSLKEPSMNSGSRILRRPDVSNRSSSTIDPNLDQEKHSVKFISSSQKMKKDKPPPVKLAWHKTPVDRRKVDSEKTVPHKVKLKNPLLNSFRQAMKSKAGTVSSKKPETDEDKAVNMDISPPSTAGSDDEIDPLPRGSQVKQSDIGGSTENAMLKYQQASVQTLANRLVERLQQINSASSIPNDLQNTITRIEQQTYSNMHVTPDDLEVLLKYPPLDGRGDLIMENLPHFQTMPPNTRRPMTQMNDSRSILEENSGAPSVFPVIDMNHPPLLGMVDDRIPDIPSSTFLNSLVQLPPPSMIGNSKENKGLQSIPDSQLHVNTQQPDLSKPPPFVPSHVISPTFPVNEQHEVVQYPIASRSIQASLLKRPKIPVDNESDQISIPDGTGSTKFPAPDISMLVFDPHVGYRYDTRTGLHYDANSGYFFNNKLKIFLFWDMFTQTYLRVENSKIPFLKTREYSNKSEVDAESEVPTAIINMKELIERNRQVKLAQNQPEMKSSKPDQMSKEEIQNRSELRDSVGSRGKDHRRVEKRSRSRSNDQDGSRRKQQGHSKSREGERSISTRKVRSRSRSQEKDRRKVEKRIRSRSRDQERSRSRQRGQSKSNDGGQSRCLEIDWRKIEKRNRSWSKDRDRSRSRQRGQSKSKDGGRSRSQEKDQRKIEKRNRSRSKARDRSRSRQRGQSKSKDGGRSRSTEKDQRKIEKRNRSRSKARDRSRSRQRGQSKSKDGGRSRSTEKDRSRDLSRYQREGRSRSTDQHGSRSEKRCRSKSRDRGRSHEKDNNKNGKRDHRSKSRDHSRRKSPGDRKPEKQSRSGRSHPSSGRSSDKYCDGDKNKSKDLKSRKNDGSKSSSSKSQNNDKEEPFGQVNLLAESNEGLSSVPVDMSEFIVLDKIIDGEESNEEMTEETLALLLAEDNGEETCAEDVNAESNKPTELPPEDSSDILKDYTVLSQIILDDESQCSEPTSDASDKERTSASSSKTKKGSVFARLSKHVSPDLPVGHDPNLLTHVHPITPTRIIHIKPIHIHHTDESIAKSSLKTYLRHHKLPYEGIAFSSRNTSGNHIDHLTVTFRSETDAQIFYDKTSISIYVNKLYKADHILCYAEREWKCKSCPKLNVFYRTYCWFCFSHKDSGKPCVTFAVKPTKFVALVDVPPSVCEGSIMEFLPTEIFGRSTLKSIQIVEDPTTKCCCGLVVIETDSRREAKTIFDLARKFAWPCRVKFVKYCGKRGSSVSDSPGPR